MRLLVLFLLAVLTLACAKPNPPPTAEGVVGKLKTAGLPVENITVYTVETDPNKLLGRPGQYVGKATFVDGRLPRGEGGSVEIFGNSDDLTKRKTYVEAITKSVSAFAQYTYAAGPALLYLSRELTPDQAEAYRVAFETAMR